MSARPARALRELDVRAYAAVAAAHSPVVDAPLAAISRAADLSKPWLASAGLLSVAGGPRGRRAAATGMAAIGVTSAVVNLVLKPLSRRRRPDRGLHAVPDERRVPMPESTSFPSGHAASAFAFATGVGAVHPAAGRVARGAAAVVAYSRVHTGVHYPGDVLAGSLIGVVLGRATAAVMARRATSGRIR